MTRTGRPRVHVIPETEIPSACAALRLLDPFSYPAITEAFDVSVDIRPLESRPDILVMHRRGPPDMEEARVEDLVRSLKRTGTRLVYDLDDNLLDTHPDTATELSLVPQRRLVRFLIRRADRVTVSTAALRDRVRHLNPRVTVLPNALDERRFCPSAIRATTGPMKIGYFGTYTHLRDLMSVVGELRGALSRLRGRVTVVLCGISSDDRLPALFEGLAPVQIMPTTADYPSFLKMMWQQADWSIGLAPLAMGAFEAAKSDIKFLEYAALGIPGLYSAHPAYDAVQDGITGMVAAPDQWADRLCAMANDAALRARIVNASRTYLLSHRTLAKAIHNWLAVLEEEAYLASRGT
jgi:glycosyltransferase involved in cell wall biosynthesis